MAERKGLGSCIKTEDREIRSLFLQSSNGRLDMERTDGPLYECLYSPTDLVLASTRLLGIQV